jgi:hypothetical protein
MLDKTAVLAIFLLSSFSLWPALGQSVDNTGNPAVIKRGYTFVMRAPNDPATRSITGSEFIDVYYKSLESQKSAEVLQIYMPAPTNAMSQIAARIFELSCDTGSVRFTRLSTYDGQWKKEGSPREMLGSKWELPMENSFAYIALKLSCPPVTK